MRKSTFLMTAALMACYITVNAQTEPKFKPSIDQLYLTVDEVPNAVYWLPAPPEGGAWLCCSVRSTPMSRTSCSR